MMERRVWVVMADCHCPKCGDVQATCLGVYTVRRDAEEVAEAYSSGPTRIEEHILEEEWNA